MFAWRLIRSHSSVLRNKQQQHCYEFNGIFCFLKQNNLHIYHCGMIIFAL